MANDQLDRHTDGRALAASAKAAQAEGSLSNLSTIEGLLMKLSGEVVARFAEAGDGQLTPEDAANADLQACWDLALVFTGGNDEYATDPSWHGGALAAYLRNKLSLEGGSDQEVVAQAFGVFVHFIYDNLRQSDDEEVLKAALLENVRSFSWALAGLDTDD